MEFIYDLDRLSAIASSQAGAYRGGHPFPHIVLDQFLKPASAAALAAAVTGPGNEIAWDRYAAEGFEMKLACSREEELPETVCRALHELNAGPMLRFLEALTGIGHLLPDPQLLGGGLHLVGRGGHLGVHADFNWHPGLQANRRINLLLYLNQDWDPAWGGDLELWSTDAARREKSIAPLFNRAVIFNTRSDTFHGHPAPLATPEGVWRRSIAMYYYTTTRPEAEQRAPHNTRYKGMHLP
ncbi:2OG-Fe(II) oxygenase [Arenimonas donghaensis]|uniref:Prolyl 4-hydroxylase alpha subunit Fe(2+) 2OG dioxygenase domain-containing protein n=1 Tax=Arenimonas donghaensis DSM 18148 = HO3-R19 TaxID=1121014 RepID=A0A087MMM1_9GAMM|nr:2OG-Fe(II) oxygenase [Arenimonas donghaensis]KFL38124.1 hypothetical protein N788_02795 [Arenimonas donghaensis DSM 18148 = HO3-R19]